MIINHIKLQFNETVTKYDSVLIVLTYQGHLVFVKNKKSMGINISSSVLEYKMTKCTSKWTTFFILTYIPNYIQNDL